MNVAELNNAFMDTPTPGPSQRNIVKINVDRAESSQSLKNLDGKTIKQEKAFDFEKRA